MVEAMPTENDQDHITPLAQILIDTAQEYALANNMSLQGVMSAVGTMVGAMLARAYRDPDTAKEVAQRISIAAVAMVDYMHAGDPIIRGRRS